MRNDFIIGKDWLVQPRLNRISNTGKSVRLLSKYMHVLLCLVERPGEPDGRHLAFVRHSLEGCTIFKIPSAGGPAEKLLEIARGAHPFDPAWSPDGRWLVYSLQRNGQDSLYLLSLETHEYKLLGAPPAGAHDRKPVFSPDGKNLAFLRAAYGKTEIYSMPVNGGEAVRLTQREHRISDFDWTPDGCALVLATQEGLWKLRIADGKEELLAAVASLDHLSMAQKSWRLAYEQASEDKNLYQISLVPHGKSEAKPAQLLGSSRTDAQPAISPDGKWIAFVSDRSGHLQIWKSDWKEERVMAAGFILAQVKTVAGKSAKSPSLIAKSFRSSQRKPIGQWNRTMGSGCIIRPSKTIQPNFGASLSPMGKVNWFALCLAESVRIGK